MFQFALVIIKWLDKLRCCMAEQNAMKDGESRGMNQTFTAVDLKYAKTFVQWANSGIIDDIVSEYQENRDRYQTLKGLKGSLRKAQRGEKGSQFEGRKHSLARPLYVISVASIQTPTGIWENATVEWLNGEISLSDYMAQCEDTNRKLEAIERVEETDLLDQVNNALRGHHVLKAVKLLSGEIHGIRTYLRGVKAWMVPYFMFHVGVIDTNVHAAIRPILMWNVENDPIYHPSMDENQRGKARCRAEKWHLGKIPPYHKDWLDYRVSEYNAQDDISAFWEIIHIVMSDAGPIPKDVLPQVLFNIGGDKQNDDWTRTIHEPIYTALGKNLKKFED